MEAILNGIKSIFNNLLGFFENFIYLMQQIGNAFLDIGSFLISILGFIYYAGKTLIIGVAKLFYNILDGSVFYNVNRAFVYISQYIGAPATIFIASLLMIIIIRILIAFVFKIMRLNIDYNSFDKQTRKANAWDNASEYRKKMSTRV